MKKISILLASVLAAVTVSGCDFIDSLIPGSHDKPGGETIDDKFTIHFVANGGTGSMNDYETRDDFMLPDCEFEYENHIFSYWAANSADGDEYYPGENFHPTKDTIFYAIWEAESGETHHVSFYANGGTGSMDDKIIYGTSYIAPVCDFTKENYDFDKWALGSPSGATYYSGSIIDSIDSDIVLYALWKEKSAVNYTVSFYANGGTGTMSSKTTTGTTYVVPQCLFLKEDYEFTNWALNSKSGVAYHPGETIVNISADITLYAIWKESSSGGDEYYKECAGLSGSDLQDKLKAINPAKSPDYDWSRYEDADEALDDPTSVLCIYTRHNIKKNMHCGSYSWDRWNREHVWTQSAYPKSASDNHNIFACEGQINNYRGNKPFAVGGTTVVVFGHTTGCKQTDKTFEPCDEAKGEIARAVMYGTVMYSYNMTLEIDSIYLALKWHLEHPITKRDTRRNEVVYKNQGNRNPFVDHPEYACKIWGNANAETRSICGGN